MTIICSSTFVFIARLILNSVGLTRIFVVTAPPPPPPGGAASVWQVLEHPSPLFVFPSSHCSPVSIMLFPQTGGVTTAITSPEKNPSIFAPESIVIFGLPPEFKEIVSALIIFVINTILWQFQMI